MARHNTLIKNTFLYAAGPLLNRIVSVVLIPWYSFLLTTEQLGYYDLVVTTTGLVIAIATLKISDAVYRWLVDTGGDDTKQAAAITNSSLIVVASIIIVIIFVAILPVRFTIQYRWLMCAYIISLIVFNFLQQILRGLGYIKMFSWLSMLNTLLLLLFNVVFLWLLKYKLNGIFLSVIFSNAVSIVMMIFLVQLSKYITIKEVDKMQILAMVKYTTPLIFNAINWWMMGGFDRFVIVGFLGLQFNGIYAVANKYAAILILLNSFFLPAWQDFILTKQTTTDKKPAFNIFFNSYIVLQISIAILLIAISKFVMIFFIDPRFVDAFNYLPLLIIGSCFSAFTSFLGSFFLIEKNTGILFKTTLAGSIINIIVSLVLVNFIGLYGVATGMLSGFLATFFLRYYFLKKSMGLGINGYPVILLAILLGLVCAAVYSGADILILLAALLSTAVVVVMNKKVWMALLSYLRRG
jgi:O-antigen/teichoic acid export membrane protein